MRKRKIDREIHKIESEFENLRSKILKAARDSQTGFAAENEMIYAINKKIAEKNSELRLLRLNHIKNNSKLKKKDKVGGPMSKITGSSSVKREELSLENKVQ